jgi:hypothetical protein
MTIAKFIYPIVLASLTFGYTAVLAQNRSESTSPEQIRKQAANLKEYRDLLASPDPSIRFAAVSEMLKSTNNTLRAMAFDAAFQSADSAIKALALKERILTMSGLVIEAVDPRQAEELAVFGLAKFSIPIGKPDMNRGTSETGYFNPHNLYGTLSVAGEEFSFQVSEPGGRYVRGRFRLGDGGKLNGSLQWQMIGTDNKFRNGIFPAFTFVN